MQKRERLVLHITNIPTPYRLPYFRSVSEALQKNGFHLHVFFLGKGKRQREWQFVPSDMEGFEWTSHPDPASGSVAPIIAMIRERKPDMVTLAWAMDPRALRLLLFCRRHRIPCMVMTGETSHTAGGRSYPAIRNLVRQPFFRLANRFLTYGTKASEYLRENGVLPGKITTGLNVVDTRYFRQSVEALRASGDAASERERYRTRSGRAFDTHLLMVNYMIPGKGISNTIEALKRLDREDIALHIVGSGPREESHRALVESLGLQGSVFFHGYRQIPDIFLFYAFSDIFLFPSSIDIFGLVMVEAAAAALPVIASPYSGGTVDVVVEEVTGLIVDPADIDRYAAAIGRLSDDAGLCRRMGEAARSRSIDTLTLERSSSHYLSAVQELLDSRGEERNAATR